MRVKMTKFDRIAAKHSTAYSFERYGVKATLDKIAKAQQQDQRRQSR